MKDIQIIKRSAFDEDKYNTPKQVKSSLISNIEELEREATMI